MDSDEKTMLICEGFQTGNLKPIYVSSQSMEAAKKKFEDVIATKNPIAKANETDYDKDNGNEIAETVEDHIDSTNISGRKEEDEILSIIRGITPLVTPENSVTVEECSLQILKIFPRNWFLNDKNYYLGDAAFHELRRKEMLQFNENKLQISNDVVERTRKALQEERPGASGKDFEEEVRNRASKMIEKEAMEMVSRVRATPVTKVNVVEERTGELAVLVVSLHHVQLDQLELGATYLVTYLAKANIKSRNIFLHSTKTTSFTKTAEAPESFVRVSPTLSVKNLLAWDNQPSECEEVDFYGKILRIGTYAVSSGQSIQIVDESGQVVRLKIYNGMKDAGLEGRVIEGDFVGVRNAKVCQPISKKKDMVFFCDVSVLVKLGDLGCGFEEALKNFEQFKLLSPEGLSKRKSQLVSCSASKKIKED